MTELREQGKPPVTLDLLRTKRAGGEPIVMVTAYDAEGNCYAIDEDELARFLPAIEAGR